MSHHLNERGVLLLPSCGRVGTGCKVPRLGRLQGGVSGAGGELREEGGERGGGGAGVLGCRLFLSPLFLRLSAAAAAAARFLLRLRRPGHGLEGRFAVDLLHTGMVNKCLFYILFHFYLPAAAVSFAPSRMPPPAPAPASPLPGR